MSEQTSRRERKKAATRQAIANTALTMFLERGYDAVGIREVAQAADVAVTTVFAHFPSKEALVFDRDQGLQDRLVDAVTGRGRRWSAAQALRDELHVMVHEFTGEQSAVFWRLVDGSPELREYESRMWQRHADALALAIAADRGRAEPATTDKALARYVLGVFPLAREAPDPATAVDEIMDLVDAAWAAARQNRAAEVPKPAP
ncbi:TetR/AcrR family transcriptional regulator [Actinoplanes sp. TRM 88003]|uniref:TetR/AcrR family transcriptional regulator n=1 Tax=Paractinoplanes aksuensis TaxID=2939490 RepID=A0ABT1DFN1_9ACTN|nr:TetR/AcrR family transcriptional regulator [Actinoplanes aksuensis]MCO8269637.1 TetR/AcrR family transcriptional regulator [Actinoplanes aksuensis]